jgi:hypothetical protein
MARKVGSKPVGKSEPVKLSNRLASACCSLIGGGCLGGWAGSMLHIKDSMIWVLLAAGCAIIAAIIGFIFAPAGLNWNSEIRQDKDGYFKPVTKPDEDRR